jgi:hypothetical protein
MALRKATNDKREGMPPPGAGGVGAEPKVGASVVECFAVGQALVEAGHT